MLGTIVNTSAVLAGSLVGIYAGRGIGDRLKETLMKALGLAVAVIGLQMALSAKGLIPSVACLLLGAITGELLAIERSVEKVGEYFKARFNSSSHTFVQGFMTATMLYITGAMVIVGCVQDGISGNPDTLFLKSILDGVSAIALASTLGIGVAFSAVSVFVVQGSLTLLAAHTSFLQNPAVLSLITATGGIMILGIGINLLGLTVIRVGNMIPALVYAAVYPLFFP
jgi:uncharacterized protein